ncbi:MAG: hypothetical protein AAGH74_12495 [Pseudomonadota bacterium]
MWRFWLVLFLTLISPWAEAKDKLLFIGNSYTAQWGVARQVEALLGARITEAIDISRFNVTLDWHLREGEALAWISRGDWAVVILQDYSDTALRPAKAAISRFAIDRLAEAARAEGAEIVFFAHWTPAGTPKEEEELHRAQIQAYYEAAARRHQGRVAPVGLAWAKADKLLLRHPDQHHANALGASLAAITLAMALAPLLEAPLEPPAVPPDAIPAGQFEAMWQAAQEAVFETQ